MPASAGRARGLIEKSIIPLADVAATWNKDRWKEEIIALSMDVKSFPRGLRVKPRTYANARNVWNIHVYIRKCIKLFIRLNFIFVPWGISLYTIAFSIKIRRLRWRRAVKLYCTYRPRSQFNTLAAVTCTKRLTDVFRKQGEVARWKF